MLSPLCGLDQRIGFFTRSGFEPRFMTVGAEMTGIHVLRNEPPPKQAAYHIGGGGIVAEEALIRVLAETAERYSQFISEISERHEILLTSHDELSRNREPVIGPDKLQYFSAEQFARAGFPFRPFRPDAPIGWITARSLVTTTTLWVPAQLLLVGYMPKRRHGEPWLCTAVTTGSAAHTNADEALRNGLLELIQIDSAMGHWYSPATAPRIMLDQRTVALERVIAHQFRFDRPTPTFYWLLNADLGGMTVACVLKNDPQVVPAAAVGLGSDLRLVDAMYKALLEAVGVAQLAKVVLFEQAVSSDEGQRATIDPAQIFDLDRNVALYARPPHSSYIATKFDDRAPVEARDLPADFAGQPRDEVVHLVDGFRRTGKELVFLDLTTQDIRELGLCAIRVWSPDTLSLCLPSAPPLAHPRLLAYGGAGNENPHPYP
jgi:thiazole/oxazole-forming peptide maturase SagD family component